MTRYWDFTSSEDFPPVRSIRILTNRILDTWKKQYLKTLMKMYNSSHQMLHS